MGAPKSITKKQFLKRKTLALAHGIHRKLLTEEDAASLTLEDTKKSFPKVSHYRHNVTGEIRVGMSMRGIHRLVKKYPLITLEQVAEVYNIG